VQPGLPQGLPGWSQFLWPHVGAPHLRDSPPSATGWARGASVGGEGGIVVVVAVAAGGARPPLLPTATDGPNRGRPDIGRGSGGGTFLWLGLGGGRATACVPGVAGTARGVPLPAALRPS
jgi:hypothetical protein